MAVSQRELNYELVFEQNLLITDGEPIYRSDSGISAFSGRRNLLWDLTRKEPMLYQTEDTVYTLSEWQSALNHDMGSIVADPSIAGLLEYDFTLSHDSPALALGFRPLPDAVAKNKA